MEVDNNSSDSTIAVSGLAQPLDATSNSDEAPAPKKVNVEDHGPPPTMSPEQWKEATQVSGSGDPGQFDVLKEKLSGVLHAINSDEESGQEQKPGEGSSSEGDAISASVDEAAAASGTLPSTLGDFLKR